MGDMATKTDTHEFLDGRFLVAMPMMGDSRFARSVVYLCAHSAEGAMGIIVNKLVPDIDFRDLLVQLNIIDSSDGANQINITSEFQVRQGGPVETGRGFVLHSADYHIESATLQIRDGISLTATLDILRAIIDGRGPDRSIFALGYAGWQPGQLESEIQSNGWLISDTDVDILFDDALDTKYDRALANIGVDPGMLSVEGGTA